MFLDTAHLRYLTPGSLCVSRDVSWYKDNSLTGEKFALREQGCFLDSVDVSDNDGVRSA